VIANLRYLDSATVDQVDQALSEPDSLGFTVNGGCHFLSPPQLILDGIPLGNDA
jgi:hypothetical protein